MYRAFKLNGNGKAKLVVGFVDSGADETIISERIAKELGLRCTGKFETTSASGDRIVGKLATVTIVDDSGERTMTVGVTDVPFLDEEEEGVEILIGHDYLQQRHVTLKY